jgi:protein involved in polysaccharide export with SLBB domain
MLPTVGQEAGPVAVPDSPHLAAIHSSSRSHSTRTCLEVSHTNSLALRAAAGYFTLQPGDLLLTGTPPGVGPLAPGDTVRCAIDGLGTMRVEVK